MSIIKEICCKINKITWLKFDMFVLDDPVSKFDIKYSSTKYTLYSYLYIFKKLVYQKACLMSSVLKLSIPKLMTIS